MHLTFRNWNPSVLSEYPRTWYYFAVSDNMEWCGKPSKYREKYRSLKYHLPIQYSSVQHCHSSHPWSYIKNKTGITNKSIWNSVGLRLRLRNTFLSIPFNKKHFCTIGRPLFSCSKFLTSMNTMRLGDLNFSPTSHQVFTHRQWKRARETRILWPGRKELRN